MVFGGSAEGNRSRAVGKSVKVAFHPRGVDKKMSLGTMKTKETIGISDKEATAYTLVDFGAIATYSVQRREKTEHCLFRRQEN